MNPTRNFRISLTALNKYPGAILVHGTVQGDKPYAWLDLGEKGIYNPETRRVMTSEEFTELFQPIETVRYTEVEAWERRKNFGGWGPWDT